MSTVHYQVRGMTCGGCVSTLRRALEQALPGANIAVELDGGLVHVSGEHTVEVVSHTVADAGFDFVGVAPS